MDLNVGDIVEMKKTHPCGGKRWSVLRVGMDIKLKCLTCGHEVMSARSRIEKSIRKVEKPSEEQL